ncbi:hypothetical protein DFQ04_1833 [Algoriphagus boseongensis]|uniref:Dolichyl-phosphate-mannose-protein mannosyltransferase n=1 Tax=Algoriphagus boseongensis TaxID=1442587 RepID=A0A4R6T3Z3_9BACT|nr:hypothetical protein [Algoriphagus boseongensis]TDQ17181.1 hypothetical protein DFQ04_1833 [Algoriphagus boseongensis]
MFSFFKVNDPFRLIGVAIYLIVLTVIYLVFFPSPLTEPTLLWMVLGERLNEGFSLYKDVVDDTGPLSAAFFEIMDWLFGRNQIAYELVGRFLILFQIFHWNSSLLKYRVFDENSYLPAIIMAALFHFSFDLLGLSPALLGNTFLVLALGQLFSQTVLQKETSESTLLIGLYGGLATGFHLYFAIFLPYILFTGLVISGFSFRQLILALVGFFLPLVLILVYYFWNDSLTDILEIYPSIFTYPDYSYQSILTWLIPGSLPILLSLGGYFFSTFLRGATINQQKQKQLIILWLIFSALVFFLVKRQAAFQLVVFIPGMTYLINQFFLSFRSGLIGKLAFYFLILGLPAAGIVFWQNQTQTSQGYFVSESNSSNEWKGKKIMVMGEDSSPYLDAQLGGPFINFHLAQDYLAKEKSLEEKTRVYRKIFLQKPEVVLDPQGTFRQFMDEFPAIKAWYQEKENGIFYLK